MATERLAYKINEAAEALNVSRATIYRMINDGEVRTVRLRDHQRIPAAELQRLCAL